MRRTKILSAYDQQLKNYAQYIYEYCLSLSIPSDDAIDLLIASFKWNSELWPLSSFTTDGSAVENYSWNTHAEAFLELVNRMTSLVVATTNTKSRYYRSSTLWQIAEKVVDESRERLPLPPTNFKFPWGDNWYVFSISFPRMLVIMSYLYRQLYDQPNLRIENYLATFVNNYFVQTSNTDKYMYSIGWGRDGPNAVMMSVPYIGGTLLTKTYRRDDPANQCTLKFMNLEYVTEKEGFYLDGGYIFHTSLRAYGYVYSSYQDFLLLSKFFGYSLEALQRIYEIFEHPTIPLHFGPWFTRSNSLSSGVRGVGKLGAYVVDSIKAVVYKTEDWYLGFNGQTMPLCYYEADRSNYTWGQFWTGARMFLYADSDKTLARDLVTRYPGVISYANELAEIRSTTTTTETHMPSAAKCMIVHNGDCVGMRNEYRIDHPLYQIAVDEMILVTPKGYHIHLRIKPTSRSETLPITVSANLGKFVQELPESRAYQFEKNKTFLYTDSKNISVKTVINPNDEKALTSLQIVPPIDYRSDYLSAAFSTMHSLDNECVLMPTNNLIRTTTHMLDWDESRPDHLFLYDGTTDRVGVTFYAPYTETIAIPTKILRKTIGGDALKGHVILGENVMGRVSSNGPQIIFSNVRMPPRI